MLEGDLCLDDAAPGGRCGAGTWIVNGGDDAEILVARLLILDALDAPIQEVANWLGFVLLGGDSGREDVRSNN